jgi:hypothetical protein
MPKERLAQLPVPVIALLQEALDIGVAGLAGGLFSSRICRACSTGSSVNDRKGPNARSK